MLKRKWGRELPFQNILLLAPFIMEDYYLSSSGICEALLEAYSEILHINCSDIGYGLLCNECYKLANKKITYETFIEKKIK